MEPIQNQNSTRGFSSLLVSRWESPPQMSSYENSVIITLGVLTFALQLCLALLVMWRFLMFDNKVRKAVERSQTLQKLQIDPSSCQRDVSKQTSYQPYNDSCLSSAAIDGCYTTATDQNCLMGPSIPWDLVQS